MAYYAFSRVVCRLYGFLTFCIGEQGQIQEFAKGGRSLPFPSSPLPLSISPLPPLSFPLEIGPIKPAKGPGRAQWGPWPKTNLVHSKAARKPLVANNFECSEYHVL